MNRIAFCHKIRNAFPAVVLRMAILLMPALVAVSADADFFRYVGPDGQMVFVDDLGKVPIELRPQVKRYGEVAPAPDQAPGPNSAQTDPATQQPEETAKGVTPIFIQRDRVFVPVLLGYGILETEALLVLDTGASVTTLYRDTVDRLFMRGLDRTIGRTASGASIPVELATLDFIQVGPHRKERLRVGIVDPTGPAPKYDGMLGMDFLGGIDFNIDFQREVLVWQ